MHNPITRKILLALLCLLVIFIGNHSRIIGADPIAQIVYAPRLTKTTLFRFDALIIGALLKICENILESFRFKKLWGLTCFLIGISFYYAIFVQRINYDEPANHMFLLAYLSAGGFMAAGIFKFKPIIVTGEIPILRLLGKNSYGLYLWHYVLLFIFVPWANTALYKWPIIFFYLLVSLLVGVLSTSTVEKFFLNLRKRIAP